LCLAVPFHNDSPTTHLSALSLHDALPISAYLAPTDALEDAFHDVRDHQSAFLTAMRLAFEAMLARFDPGRLQDDFDRQLKKGSRSEEHTSELQSRENLVCRLLLEKKKKRT